MSSIPESSEGFETRAVKIERFQADPKIARILRFRAQLEAASKGLIDTVDMPVEGVDKVLPTPIRPGDANELAREVEPHLIALCEGDSRVAMDAYNGVARQLQEELGLLTPEPTQPTTYVGWSYPL